MYTKKTLSKQSFQMKKIQQRRKYFQYLTIYSASDCHTKNNKHVFDTDEKGIGNIWLCSNTFAV